MRFGRSPVSTICPARASGRTPRPRKLSNVFSRHCVKRSAQFCQALKQARHLGWSRPATAYASCDSRRRHRQYERAKQRRHGLDFDDLLLHTRNLLRDHSALARASLAVAGSIEFILVDEFQDTDLIQSEILELLGGSAFESGRMFVVGDPKQSIYRFRGAEPAIFGQWRSAFPEEGRLSLTENFRSVPGVLHFVNALFADCFAATDPTRAAAPASVCFLFALTKRENPPCPCSGASCGPSGGRARGQGQSRRR